MSQKVKNNKELRDKFARVFINTTKLVAVGQEEMTRGELRKLEAMGLLERIYASGKRKWLDVEPTRHCVWRRKGEVVET